MQNITCCIKAFTFYRTIPTLNDPKMEAFENILGKGENAGNQHFLLIPKCFLPFPKQISIFGSHLFCFLQMLSIWTSLDFSLFGKWLNLSTWPLSSAENYTGVKLKNISVV